MTLDDLRQLIVAGEKIKVIDDKSGEDLTRSVLLQIISEQEQFGSPVLGPELLEMIIRFYGASDASAAQPLPRTSLHDHAAATGSDAVGDGQGTADAVCTACRARAQEHEMWEQMQAATRDAFIGRSAGGAKTTDHERPTARLTDE